MIDDPTPVGGIIKFLLGLDGPNVGAVVHTGIFFRVAHLIKYNLVKDFCRGERGPVFGPRRLFTLISGPTPPFTERVGLRFTQADYRRLPIRWLYNFVIENALPPHTISYNAPRSVFTATDSASQDGGDLIGYLGLAGGITHLPMG